MKKIAIVYHLFPYDLENASKGSLILTARPTQSHSWMLKALLMVTHTAYIRPLSRRLLGEQPIAGPHPDGYPFSKSLLKDRGQWPITGFHPYDQANAENLMKVYSIYRAPTLMATRGTVYSKPSP